MQKPKARRWLGGDNGDTMMDRFPGWPGILVNNGGCGLSLDGLLDSSSEAESSRVVVTLGSILHTSTPLVLATGSVRVIQGGKVGCFLWLLR